MLIKELKEQIKDMDDNLMIYLQIDPEGNGYYHLGGIDECVYIMKKDIDEHCPDIYSPEDIIEYEDDEFVKVAVVYP